MWTIEGKILGFCLSGADFHLKVHNALADSKDRDKKIHDNNRLKFCQAALIKMFVYG